MIADVLYAIHQLAEQHPAAARELAQVERLPIPAVTFGAAGPVPVLIVVGGVHGIERIGAEVAIAFLTALGSRLSWDQVWRHALARCRIVVLPLLNPVGMALGQRANGNGVDLMRNAPPSRGRATPLLGGQRLTPKLPWFMGRRGLEVESRALVELVASETRDAPFAFALDLHSGYGVVDRLWYPYARTREPIADVAAVRAFGALLDESLPNHVYTFEQTARAYTIKGDLWDHIYDERRTVLLPLTLEMGSWAWVRKNPLQGLSPLGRFNPIKPHRHRRTLRRHLPLLELLVHATVSYRAWVPSSSSR
ncbi:MAG: DUF2817 domain-containing protein [Myxococcales bacterium]|nr:DUF2817 domain-containing protein [Myxococcales bacterium]